MLTRTREAIRMQLSERTKWLLWSKHPIRELDWDTLPSGPRLASLGNVLKSVKIKAPNANPY